MYLALYRKWRPQKFDDVVSQSHITSTLKHEISTGRIAHAYLFTGSRGTGKTTCAKIFAKALNCLNPVNGEPCGVCDICKGLEDGSILDVYEMDGASNNRVDDVRLLREEAAFTPVSCKYRVYIIDEVHMLSISAFNALLKIMEEPPSHVIFILATTEVHKIPATILSRCQRFDFHRIKTEDIKNRLLYISQKEGISLTDDAALLIARCADGAMRDALALLDQAAASTDNITEEEASELIGLASSERLFLMEEAIEKNDTAEALSIIQSLYESSKDLGRFLEELILFYRNILIEKSSPGSDGIIIASLEDYNRICSIAKNLSFDDILNVLSSLQECFRRLSTASNKRLELEICLIQITSKKQIVHQNEPEPEQILNQPQRKQDNIAPISNSVVENIKSTPLQENISDENSNDTSAPKKSSQPPKPLVCWPDILETLKEDDSAAMLSGFLTGSTAYVKGDSLYIRSPNTIVTDSLAKKRDVLESVIKKHTGQNYRLLFKGSSSVSETSNLEKVLKRAKEEGVPIENE